MAQFCTLDELANESDVEQKLIMPMLTTLSPDGLGYFSQEIWTKPDIRQFAIGKSNKKLYHPDYVIIVAGIPILIVEAKHPDQELEDAGREARLYATELNATYPSGVNPCRYVVSSNGKELILCDWDSDAPNVSLKFDDFSSVDLKYAEFISAFGRDSILGQAQAIRNQISLNGELHRAVNLLGGVTVRNEEVGYNAFGSELSVNFSHLFNPENKKQRMHVARNAYVNSKRREHYLDEIDRVVKNALPRKKAGVKPIEDTENPAEILHVLGRGSELQNKILLLVGARGAGKSTFVEYFQSMKLPAKIADATSWVTADFKVNPPSADKMEDWTLDQIASGLMKCEPSIDFSEWETQEKVFGIELRDFKKGAVSLLKDDLPAYNKEIYQFVKDLVNNKEAYVRCLGRYVAAEKGKLLVLVFDNADKGAPEEQLKAFQVVQWVQSWLPCVVFLPIRDVTYETRKNIPPLDTIIKEFIFRIEPPQFTKVLKQRVRLALAELKKTSGKKVLEYSLENGAKVTYPESEIGTYLACIYRSLYDHDHLLRRMLVGLAGHDIRRAMEIFLDFCKSGHIGNKELLKIRALNGNYSLPYGVVTRVLLRLSRRFYDGDDSHVKNLFQAEPDEQNPNHLVRFSILHWLADRRKRPGPTGIRGFHRVAKLLSELGVIGFTVERIHKELLYLIASHCIYTEHQKAEILEPDDLVIIAPAGFATLRLSRQLDYLAACSEETWLADESLADEIAKRIGANGISGHYRRTTTRRNAYDFANYLVDASSKTIVVPQAIKHSGGQELVHALDDVKANVDRAIKKEEGGKNWTEFSANYGSGDECDGTVDGKADFGIFIRIDNGPVGLMHNSRIPTHMSISDFSEGDKVRVQLLNVDLERERLGLQFIEKTDGNKVGGV